MDTNTCSQLEGRAGSPAALHAKAGARRPGPHARLQRVDEGPGPLQADSPVGAGAAMHAGAVAGDGHAQGHAAPRRLTAEGGGGDDRVAGALDHEAADARAVTPDPLLRGGGRVADAAARRVDS